MLQSAFILRAVLFPDIRGDGIHHEQFSFLPSRKDITNTFGKVRLKKPHYSDCSY